MLGMYFKVGRTARYKVISEPLVVVGEFVHQHIVIIIAMHLDTNEVRSFDITDLGPLSKIQPSN